MKVPISSLETLALIGTLGFLLPSIAISQASAVCTDDAPTLAYWQKTYDNREDSRDTVDDLARDLLPCLGSPNSKLRDTYGYGLYNYWLRNDRLSIEGREFLLESVSANLESSNSMLRSFSALILSEVLRADNIEPFISAAGRTDLLNAATAALIVESDYRGLDAQLGWIHPVAHMADVLWRFALYSDLSAAEARQILPSLRLKAATPEASYIANEGDRLARVAAVIIRSDVLPEQEIVEWLSNFESRGDGEDWRSAFASVAGMAELHNVKLFIRALTDQLRDIELSESIDTKLLDLTTLFVSLV